MDTTSHRRAGPRSGASCRRLRAAVLRLAAVFETDDVVVTAGGSTHFDLVAEMLTGWPAGLAVRTVLRSGCYLTHDDGLYQRTSPLAFTAAWACGPRCVRYPNPAWRC